MSAVGTVWIALHVLSSITTAIIVLLNVIVFASAQRSIGVLEKGNQSGTDRWHRAEAIASGSVARGIAHLSIGFVTVISITEGTRYVGALPGDSLWAYILPVLIAYNLTVLAMGYLSVLAYQGAMRLYHDVSGIQS